MESVRILLNVKYAEFSLKQGNNTFVGTRLTTRNRILLPNLILPWMVKKFTTFYGTHRFITMFKRPCHFLSQTNPAHVFPSFFFNIYLILSSHLHLFLPSGLFSSGFPTITLLSLRATCPAHLIVLDLFS